MFFGSTLSGPTNGIEPRKQSRSNLENLYSFILNMINNSGAVYRAELIGVSGLVFNKIQIFYMKDALALIATLKLTRAWYLSYIRGVKLPMKGFKPTEWDFESESPVLLQGVLEIMEKHTKSGLEFVDMLLWHRVLFALLSMDRVIVLPVPANYSTITAPYSGESEVKGQEDCLLTNGEIQAALSSMGITKESFKEAYNLNVSRFHYEPLSSAGPNGQATWTAHSDVRAWNKYPELFKQLRVLLEESGMAFMIKDMYGTAYLPETDLAAHRRPYLGKLNVIEEWGGKARIVAALDYWSQMALTPLHNTVNDFLRGLNSDGTFDQTKIINKAREWTKSEVEKVNCFDLSAATDRLPINLQKAIIGYVMGSSSFSSAWKAILSQREFLTPEGKLISYAVGQPMGARSSFPMLALTHHVIIRVAAARAKVEGFTNYGVVGDDSIMCSEEVALHYRSIMEAYGVPINLSKSVLHSDDLLKAGEICKRVFVSGYEISTIPVKTIVKTVKDGRHVSALHNELVTRNPKIENSELWFLLSSILDVESLTTHIKNNLVPTSVSGLVKAFVPAGITYAEPKTWFKTEFTNEDVVQVYTWTVAVEGLKRLDALLRSSLSVANLIALKARESDPGFDATLLSEIAPEMKAVSEQANPEAAAALKELPPLNVFHPIVQASEYEARRLSDDLFLLASSDSVMVSKARSGLLDRFRNALTDIWVGRAAPQPSQDRALIVKAFRNMETLCVVNLNSRLDYSVVLSMVGRTWSVSLSKGSEVLVNSVKSRVPTSSVQIKLNLNEAIKKVSFVSEVAVTKRKSLEAKKPRGTTSSSPSGFVNG